VLAGGQEGSLELILAEPRLELRLPSRHLASGRLPTQKRLVVGSDDITQILRTRGELESDLGWISACTELRGPARYFAWRWGPVQEIVIQCCDILSVGRNATRFETFNQQEQRRAA